MLHAASVAKGTALSGVNDLATAVYVKAGEAPTTSDAQLVPWLANRLYEANTNIGRRSGWNPPFGSPFAATLHSLEGHRQMDIGCALEDGAFSMRNDGSRRVLEHSCSQSSLITFVMTLLRQLQTMGSAPSPRIP